MKTETDRQTESPCYNLYVTVTEHTYFKRMLSGTCSTVAPR